MLIRTNGALMTKTESKQLEVLRFIHERKDKGYPPTVREICSC